MLKDILISKNPSAYAFLLEDKNRKFSYHISKKSLLKESPTRVGNYIPFEFEDSSYSERMYNDTIKYYEYVGDFTSRNGKELMIYKDERDSDILFRFIPKDFNSVVGQVSLEEIDDNGVEIVSVYNDPNFSGSVYNFYFQYLLKNYKFIRSGGIQSKRGEEFWKKIVFQGLKEGYKFSVEDTVEKNMIDFNDISDFDKFYDNSPSYERYRFIIYAK